MSKVTFKGGKEVTAPRIQGKHMGWRFFLVWLAGFLSSALVAGIAAIILSTTLTTKETLSLFGVDANTILQPYYQGMSILDLMTSLPTLKYETLGDIYKITPLVKDLIEETVNPVLEKELHFQYVWEEISIKPFELPVAPREDGSVDPNEDLSTYLGRAIKEGVYLKDFFSADNIPPLVNLFLYPKNEQGEFDYDDPYCLMDFINADSEFFDRIMNSIKIKDVISNPDHFPLLEEEGGIGGWSINDFTAENIDSLQLGLFIDQGTTDPLMQEISSWSVGDLKQGEKFNDLELGLFIGESSDPLLEELSTWTVSELKSGDKIDDLTLGLLIGPTSDPLMEELSTWTVSDVKDGSKINDLTLGLFLNSESTDPFIQELSTWTVAELKEGDKIDNLSLGLFLEQESEDPLIEELSTWVINDLKDTDNFKNLELGNIIKVQENTPQILIKLINDHYTIGMLESTNLYNVLTVGDVFDTSDNRLLAALSGTLLSGLEDEDTILDLKIGDVLPTDEEDSIVAKFSENTLREISELDIHNIELKQIFSDAEINADSVLTSLINYDEHIKIGQLTDPDVLTSLKLGDILTDTSNPIIDALKDYSIGQVPSKIDTLALGVLLNIDPDDPDTPTILKALKDEPLNNLINKINTLTIGEILDIDTTSPSTTQLMKTLASKTIDELNPFLTHITLGAVMDLSSYPNLNNDEVKNTEINDIDSLIVTLKNHLQLKDVVDINDSSPKLLKTLKNEYLKDLADRILELTIGDFVNINSDSHPLLQAIGGYSLDGLEEAIPDIRLNQIMTIDDNSHPLLYALRESTLESLPGDINDKVQNLKLNEIITINSESHPLLQALGNESISGLESAIPNIELGSLITVDENTPKLIQTLVENHVTISNLSSTVSGLKLEDIVNIDPTNPSTPQILIALKDITILDSSSLVNKINTLQLKDIYRADQCVGIFKYLWDESDGGQLPINQIPAAVNNLPLVTLLEDYIFIKDDTQAKYKDKVTGHYYTYDQLIDDHTHSPEHHDVEKYYKIYPIYWFLLTESGESFSEEEKYYVLKNGKNYTISSGLEKLTQNFAYHMQTETLFDLYDAGILDNSVLTRQDLEKTFYDTTSHTIVTVGNLTMSEFLAICISMLPSY